VRHAHDRTSRIESGFTSLDDHLSMPTLTQEDLSRKSPECRILSCFLLERHGVDRWEEESMFRETKDGGGMDEAMGGVGRTGRPGLFSHPRRNRPLALCGGASAAGRLWEREA